MYPHGIRYGFVIIILNDEFEIRFSDQGVRHFNVQWHFKQNKKELFTKLFFIQLYKTFQPLLV